MALTAAGKQTGPSATTKSLMQISLYEARHNQARPSLLVLKQRSSCLDSNINMQLVCRDVAPLSLLILLPWPFLGF
jgi:hypothetical protein